MSIFIDNIYILSKKAYVIVKGLAMLGCNYKELDN